MNCFEKIYNIVKMIPLGKVATYGQIASMVDGLRNPRVVGWALHANPYEGIVPCHRVVNRKGELSGAFAFGGMEAQKRILEEEGIIFNESGKIDLEKYLWIP